MSDEIHRYCVREEIHLPNEILAIIINKLAEYNDRSRTSLAALASCRLASHVLYSLATPLLFSSIQLMETLAPWANRNDKLMAFKERATKLKQILTTSDVAASVHTLTLRCQKVNLENSINGALISAIIYRLPHIRTFILESEGGALEFTAIAEDFALAISALCRSPSFTALYLDNIAYFPITLITACPSLQYLRLSCVGFYFDRRNPFDGTPSLQPYNLDSLEIDEDSIDSLGFGISGLGVSSLLGDISKQFSRIRDLRLRNLFCDDATLSCGWAIMLMASQSLITLDLPRDDELYLTTFPAALEGGPFNLGRFPALRHFKIQIRISYLNNAAMFSFLNQLLSISSSTSGIETLEIKITWVDVESGCEQDVFSPDAGWSALDEVLSSEKFISLKKIVFGLGLEKRRARRRACYYNQMNPELARNLTPPHSHVNALLPTFRALTGTQRTLGLHVEAI